MEGGILPPPSLFFRPAQASDLQSIIDLETASYPADEAATPDRLEFRLENAGEYFLVAVAPPTNANATSSGVDALQVVGFVCSTLTAANSLTHESMATHEPQGSLLCVHSVCVEQGQRRRGVGSKLMRAYINFIAQSSANVTEIRLLCKEHLVSEGGRAATHFSWD
jgi:arylalkylamine N-acetyltransferase